MGPPLNEERAVERVVEQIVLNDHRADLTDARRSQQNRQLQLCVPLVVTAWHGATVDPQWL
jgi:hypothetical protein